MEKDGQAEFVRNEERALYAIALEMCDGKERERVEKAGFIVDLKFGGVEFEFLNWPMKSFKVFWRCSINISVDNHQDR